MLPAILNFNEDEIFLYLRSYVKTYLNEEIRMEQVVRQTEHFVDFLPIAAQSNGKILNFNGIAKSSGISDKTVKNYFQILEDTLIGFFLPSFHRSIRKRQRQAPKFYFFDPGVKKAIQGTLKIPLYPETSEFGYAFEHFLVLECFKLNEITLSDFKFSYLMTKDNVEIDLVIERPGKPDILVEIKSTSFLNPKMVSNVSRIQKDWDRDSIAQVWSNDPIEKVIENVQCLKWEIVLERLFFT